jgi:hypothetical protein
MKRRTWPVVFGVFAFVLLSAGDCDISGLGSLINKPGSIRVTNVGATETAVVAIIADDVKSYPTLAPGGAASVETNVGGAYQVIVVMTPENQAAYRQSLLDLRTGVEKLIGGAASSAEKTELFIKLAGIKASIQALENTNAASCSGNIEIKQDEAVSVSATVSWVAQGDSGFWDLTCRSTS